MAQQSSLPLPLPLPQLQLQLQQRQPELSDIDLSVVPAVAERFQPNRYAACLFLGRPFITSTSEHSRAHPSPPPLLTPALLPRSGSIVASARSDDDTPTPPPPPPFPASVQALLAELPPRLRQYAIDIARHHAAQPSDDDDTPPQSPQITAPSPVAAISPTADGSGRYPHRIKSPLHVQNGAVTSSLSSRASFPSKPHIRHGTHPFRWENAVDDEDPVNFHYIESTWLHPSCTVGSVGPDAAEVSAVCGCSCKDGLCGVDCECAHEADLQYSKDGKIRSNAKLLRYSECWSGCSCQKHEDSSFGVEPFRMQPAKATGSKRPRQTAKHSKPAASPDTPVPDPSLLHSRGTAWSSPPRPGVDCLPHE